MAAERNCRIVIIGGGPAGLTAATYCARARLEPILIEGMDAGGQLMTTSEVENFPGFPDGIMGPELIANMRRQAEKFGTEFVSGNVTAVDLSKRPFSISVGDQTLLGNAAGSTGILQALGGTFTAQNDWLTVGNNGIGQVTVNGGTMNLGSVRVGQYADSASRTSTFSLISGTVDIKDQCNFNLGVAGNASFTQSGGTFQLNNRSDLTVASGAGTASYEISGGSLYVGRTLYVGKAGPGTFTVSGSGVTSISVGAEQATTDFQVFATGTLTAKIDAGGITAIQVKNAAQFDAGSKLDVAALAGAAPGTYTVLQVYGTGTGDKIIDNGLAFAAGVDTSKWSFSIVDSNSDTRLDRL